jgi:hypothetical protein
MTEERTPRTNETREVSTRPDDSWVPASILPDPEPQDGYVFRWIKTKVLGESDNVHVSRMFREGWQPVKAEDPRMPLLQPERSSRVSSFGKD